MALSVSQWHQRFMHQAEWTSNVRKFLFAKANATNAQRILEVGSGTGAILSQVNTRAQLYGLDLDIERLNFSAIENVNSAIFTAGDAFTLPYQSDSFDITYCHYLLLWLSDPESAMLEMVRVTRPGGYVIACAEPDYSHRIDYPLELQKFGQMQTDALRLQDANPDYGQQLPSLFSNFFLVRVSSGIIKYQWHELANDAYFESEWKMLKNDLSVIFSDLDHESLQDLSKFSSLEDEGIMYVPTIYAIGRKQLL